MTTQTPSSTGPGTVNGQSRAESVTRADVFDTDAYKRALKGAWIDPVQIGPAERATKVTSGYLDRIVATSCDFGFAMMTTGAVFDDCLTVVRFTSLPDDPTRWCELGIEPGTVLLYGPGAAHTAINRPGLSLTFVVTPVAEVEAMADRLGYDVRIPKHGLVQAIPASPRTRALSRAYDDLCSIVDGRVTGFRPGEDDVIRAVAAMVSIDKGTRSTGGGSRVDSRKVVSDCIDYATALGRIPTLAELCLVAHVSERRLRQAFTDEFELPPTRYFRLWAMQEANRKLRQSPSSDTTVTEVAARLGFLHLGRFAGHYKRVYGEPPSLTLRNEPATASG